MILLDSIDNLINKFTMYRLVLYGLCAIVATTIILAFFGLSPYSAISQIASLAILLTVGFIANLGLAKLYKAPYNYESGLITCLILFCVYSPLTSPEKALPLVLAPLVAMASKYVLAIGKKHIFNPVAITGFILGFSALTTPTWWISSAFILPVTLTASFIIIRKIRKFSMVSAFTIAALVVSYLFALYNGMASPRLIVEIIASWPLVFLGGIMLTEPQTTPPTRKLQITYGAIVGILLGSQFQIGPLYATPDLALVVGNIFAYIVSPKEKLTLILSAKNQLAQDVYEFIFKCPQKFSYFAGQFMEWTIAPAGADSRGNRRYFTIASSPTESELRLGIKISPDSSSFKKKLLSYNPGDIIVATGLAGDFTLPKDNAKNLIFIAGGIGITPFRSMIKFLLDRQEKTQVRLLYFCRTETEIAYKALWDEAKRSIGLQTHYILTAKDLAPKDWTGETGRLDEAMLRKLVPSVEKSVFYISGPNAFVEGSKRILRSANIPSSAIVTDYFPGL